MQNALVAYFSATGTTAAVAQRLAGVLGANTYEIVPAVPYTEEDLNWRSQTSRCTLEMRDAEARPAIAAPLADIAECDVLFVGFPIWWYSAPAIICTFLESLNLAGKTVVPFATSGGSNMGKTGENLAKSCPGAAVLPGATLSCGASAAELSAWVKSLKL